MKKVTLEELKAAFNSCRKDKVNNESNMVSNKRYYKFRYAAIRRYGEKKWTAGDGVIEFNPNYTVSCSTCEKAGFSTDTDQAYIVELSNGTKFLRFMRGFGGYYSDEILSEAGEQANIAAGHQANSERVKRKVYMLDGVNY